MVLTFELKNVRSIKCLADRLELGFQHLALSTLEAQA